MFEMIGGPDRDRTGDLFHAMEARSQLRHRPTFLRDATLLLCPLGSNSSNIRPYSRWSLCECWLKHGYEEIEGF